MLVSAPIRARANQKEGRKARRTRRDTISFLFVIIIQLASPSPTHNSRTSSRHPRPNTRSIFSHVRSNAARSTSSAPQRPAGPLAVREPRASTNGAGRGRRSDARTGRELFVVVRLEDGRGEESGLSVLLLLAEKEEDDAEDNGEGLIRGMGGSERGKQKGKG
jgi:hypothetical protein